MITTLPRLFVYSISWILLSFLLVTCKREVYDPLPPATQVGNGTLACRINGEVWNPYNSDFKSGSTSARYLEKSKTLYIGGFNTRTSQGFSFGLSNYTGQTGVYVLDSLCNDLPRVCANFGRFSPIKYFDFNESSWTSSQYKGKVEITKHTDGGIVSGTFSFEAQNRTTGKVVKITDGRFDMIYITY